MGDHHHDEFQEKKNHEVIIFCCNLHLVTFEKLQYLYDSYS